MVSTRVALEITEESVRAVEVSTGRKRSLVACGEVPLPREAARDSEVLDQDAVAVALRQLWSVAGIRSKSVTLGVGSRRTLVREFTTQAMAPEVLRQALPYQVQDLLPVPVTQAVLDFYPTSQQGDQVTGLLVAAVSETIEEVITSISKAKLHVGAVDFVPFGLARVARGITPPGDTVAMVHLGDHTTYVVVATDGVPIFVRIIPMDLPTTAARRESASAAEGDVTFDDALVAASSGAPGRTRATARSATVGDPLITDMVGRLRSTIAFYASRPASPPISAVSISGAGYLAPGASDALERAFELPLRSIRLGDILAMPTVLPPDLALNAVSTVGLVLGEGKR
jgi:type IV pilus assembly protein PilM